MTNRSVLSKNEFWLWYQIFTYNFSNLKTSVIGVLIESFRRLIFRYSLHERYIIIEHFQWFHISKFDHKLSRFINVSIWAKCQVEIQSLTLLMTSDWRDQLFLRNIHNSIHLVVLMPNIRILASFSFSMVFLSHWSRSFELIVNNIQPDKNLKTKRKLWKPAPDTRRFFHQEKSLNKKIWQSC